MSLRIASATERDLSLILSFIKKLAEYEKLSHVVVVTEDLLRDALFGPRPVAEVIIAYWDDEPVGFALFFHNFSTFLGRRGIYLDDLFGDLPHPAKRIAKSLRIHLAKIPKERNCARSD